MAIALQKEEEAAKKLTAAVTKTEKASWYRSISDRDEVLSAILVCIVTSLILIVLIATGNSALVSSCCLITNFVQLLYIISFYMITRVGQKVSSSFIHTQIM